MLFGIHGIPRDNSPIYLEGNSAHLEEKNRPDLLRNVVSLTDGDVYIVLSLKRDWNHSDKKGFRICFRIAHQI